MAVSNLLWVPVPLGASVSPTGREGVLPKRASLLSIGLT